MPLPDERPRQSVANLIGRFEQQGKRQASPGVSVVPRSSSVSSQIAGDAAKEDVKEKREWPPKPVASADIKPAATTLSSLSSPSMSKFPVISPQPIPDTAPPADIPTTPTPTSPEPAKPPLSKGKAAPTGTSTPTASARRSVASPAKPRSSVVHNSSTKSAASSPPQKTSLQASVSQPLRPQHTGHSMTSNPSTTRQARPVPRTAPSTPSRPKSSATHHQPVARPKTPSSGLFAPTAASLARSRNAPPPLPPPVKKMTLSSDAAERLSKPTAASLSKARMPVSVPSPPRVAKSTSAHTSAPRGQPKLKAGRTPTSDAKEGVKSSPSSVVSEPCRDSDKLVADRVENGYPSGTVAVSDVGSPEDMHGHSEVLSEATHAPATEENVHPDPEAHPEQQADEQPAEEETRNHEHGAENVPEEEAVDDHEQVHMDVHDDTVSEPAEPHVEVIGNENGVKVEPTVAGNDIEDIVKLLEGGIKPRPQSIVSIPDEEGVIMGED